MPTYCNETHQNTDNCEETSVSARLVSCRPIVDCECRSISGGEAIRQDNNCKEETTALGRQSSCTEKPQTSPSKSNKFFVSYNSIYII